MNQPIKSSYQLVKEQHNHFGILYQGQPRHLEPEEKIFYHTALTEEVNEYIEARTLEDEFDAILDILVFAYGAMLRQGFSPLGIEEVVRANMQKELGPLTDKRAGFKLDLRKPEGWKAPNLKAYL